MFRTWFWTVISGEVVLVFLTFLLKSIDISVSVANFEHVFVSWLRCEKSYITVTYCLTDTKLHLKLLLGFSAEPIRKLVNGFQV